jgi:hypothetical protein
MEAIPGSPIKISLDFNAMRKAQEDPVWKFGGGTTLQPIGPTLGDLAVKALGGPEHSSHCAFTLIISNSFADSSARVGDARRAVVHSREELFSKSLPQEACKGHHFFGPGLSHA